VNKDPYGPKRVDIKGRGRFGIMRHPYCRLKFVLREGKTMEEVVQARFENDVNKHARSATIFPERTPLRRRVNSGWAW
jgi:large subunit ribosomal protein L22